MPNTKIILPFVLALAVGVGLWRIAANQQDQSGDNQTKIIPTPKNVAEAACGDMSWRQAFSLASASEWGTQLTDNHYCNNSSRTWWIDLSMPKKGCSPALVIYTDTKKVEVNYRCTGAIPSN